MAKKAKHGGRRPGAGRPRVYPGEDLAPAVWVRLSKEERHLAEELAKAAGIPLSAWVRGAVRAKVGLR